MDYAATLLAKLPGAPKRDHGLRQLVETLETYLPKDAVEDVIRAYEFGAAAHKGQTRKSGEPYISHPVAVAQELADMHLDVQAITAALLHDVVEDTAVTLEDVQAEFGPVVAHLVDGVTRMDSIGEFQQTGKTASSDPQIAEVRTLAIDWRMKTEVSKA